MSSLEVSFGDSAAWLDRSGVATPAQAADPFPEAQADQPEGEVVAVLDTGVSNLASILAALQRAGVRPVPVQSAAIVARAERLVLPGVGTFESAMAALERLGLVEVLRERLSAGQPTLAICLGLQLLGTSSEESPGVRGLCLWPLAVRRFQGGVCVPQLGWNEVRAEPGPGALESGYFCFANSFRFDAAPQGWRAAWADHGGPFIAGLERGAVLACQFHPELSGALGARLLRRWLAASRAVEVRP